MRKKKKIPVGTIHIEIHEVGKPRFTGWTGGYGVHESKKYPKRSKRKNLLRKEIGYGN